MSLSAIKEQLANELAGVPGVKTVYRNRPEVAPAAADCPAAILEGRVPFLTLSRPAVGVTRYMWHLKILFLYSPLGLDTESARDLGIEPFPLLCANQLISAPTLNGSASGLVPDMALHMGNVQYDTSPYLGFELNLDVYEDVA